MRVMKDSGIDFLGKIPENWDIKRFKFVHIGSNTGMGIDRKYWSDSDKDRFFYTAQLNPIKTSFPDFPEWKYTTKDDLLLSRNATPYVYIPQIGSVYTDHIIRTRIKSDFDKRFIYYALKNSMLSEMADGVSLLTWSISIWNRQKLPIPPFAEQQQIVAYLDAKCDKIDKAIAHKRAVIEKLKEYRTAVITEAVTKGLNPNVEMKDSGIPWIGLINKKSSLCRLKFYSYMKGRIGWQGLKSEDFIDKGPYCVTGTDFINGKINWDTCYHVSEERYEMDSNIQLKVGDLLVTKDGTIGKLAKVTELPDKACLNSHLLISVCSTIK